MPTFFTKLSAQNEVVRRVLEMEALDKVFGEVTQQRAVPKVTQSILCTVGMDSHNGANPENPAGAEAPVIYAALTADCYSGRADTEILDAARGPDVRRLGRTSC